MLTFGLMTLTVVSLTQALTIRPENSLGGPYLARGENLAFWDLTGSAQLEGGHIRLTPDEPDKHGAIWNNFPSISNNWEYQVLFHIHGKGVYLNGDGMALWYVRESDMLHRGPVFGSKDYFCGLGVFIDTFENMDEPHKQHRHPYISAMVNNGSIHYEHDEDGTMTQIGGCHAAVRNLEVPTKIALSYVNEILSVYVDNQGLGQWQLCFRAEGIHLPTGYHFGISASTGDHSDNHDIVAVTSLNMDPPDMELLDKGDFLPAAENIQIPLRYHKEFIEEELQKVEKREVKEDDEEELDDDVDDDDDDEEEKEEEKEKKEEERKEKEKKEEERKEKEKKEKEKVEKGKEEEVDENQQQKTESPKRKEVDPPRTSIWRKLIYITGSAIIILIGISMFKKYNERRNVRIHKRLY